MDESTDKKWFGITFCEQNSSIFNHKEGLLMKQSDVHHTDDDGKKEDKDEDEDKDE